MALCLPLVADAAHAASPPAEEQLPALRQRFAGGVLRWGGDAEGGAPYQLRDPANPARVIGFEVEIADALAARIAARLELPLRAEFCQYDWVSLPLGLVKGDFDLILSGMEVRPEPPPGLRFGRPYYRYGLQLVAALDNTELRSLHDCLSRRVGTLSGSSADRYLSRLGVRQIVRYDSQTEPYLDVELGRLDAVLLDLPIATYYARSPRLHYVGERVEPGAYGPALRTADSLLADAVNVALGELMVDGRLRAILERWHLWNTDQAQLARDPHRAAELAGLGFNSDGTPRPVSTAATLNAAAQAMSLDLLAASAAQWTPARYLPLLLNAALMTVALTVASMALAVVLGLLVAVCRLYGPAPVRWGAIAYVEFFRGIPLLLLLFFLYYGLANYGLPLSAVAAAIVGFGLNYGAYEAEIYRSALSSVPAGQWDAGRALGMSDPQVFRHVVLPQALRTALAPSTNDFVALFKDTSLVSVIAVRELTKEYLVLSRSSMKFVELGLLTAVLYLLMSIPLGYLSRWFEQRFGAARG